MEKIQERIQRIEELLRDHIAIYGSAETPFVVYQQNRLKVLKRDLAEAKMMDEMIEREKAR